tara:strand:- start:381 stop:1289 length:909 start_codon:yes stop_codon:yes gene_type:complete
MAKVIVFGGINMDLFAYIPRSTRQGETITASSIEFYLGGKGANQAVAAARLGAEVAFVGTVGNDEFGEKLIKMISSESIDTSLINSKAGQTGTALINVLENSNNEVISYPGANKFTKDTFINESFLSEAEIIICQMEVNEEETFNLFKRAKKNNCTTILNLAPYKKISTQILTFTDILIVNETEFSELSGIELSLINEDVNIDPINSLKLLKSIDLIVTLGKRGILIFSNGNKTFIAGEKVNAIDTVGAGDCFVGALGYGILNGKDLLTASKLANKAASVSVTKKGAAASMPFLKDIHDLNY